MSTLPPILIVTDRGHFIAYRFLNDEVVSVLSHTAFSEGTDKLSEIVTDQAGRFASGGTDGYRHSAAERPKMIMELETRCVRHISDEIAKVLSENVGTWALAAPGEINRPIIDHLSLELQKRLHFSTAKNLVNIPSGQIADHFLKARSED